MKTKLYTLALVLTAMPAATLCAQTTAPPVFSLATGTYPMPQNFTISDSTSGASIEVCYVTSGTCNPGSTGVSSTYTGQIYTDPTTSVTHCADATASGVTSSIVCVIYSNNSAAPTAAPVITQPTNTYAPTTTTITDSVSGSLILYCVASGACVPGTAYSSGATITISSAETVCATAAASGDAVSTIACNTYLAATGGSQITGAGSSGYIPVFTGSATVGNSSVTISGSNVGIGTTSPTAPLQINSSEGLIVGNPSYNFSNYSTDEAVFAGSIALQNMSGANYVGIEFKGANQPQSGSLFLGVVPNVGGTGGELQIVNGSGQPFVAFENGGNVGIGTTTPSYALDVAGQVRATTGFVFPDNTVQTTAFTPTLCGGDYAESIDVTGNRTSYEPGDVLVIDPNVPGKFLKSNESYSTMVAGIYSTKPGYVGRRQTGPKNPEEVPMAMVGIVPTKVSAENGPIKTGDLLVASSTLGHAMKGTDRSLLTGAVIGKALGSLDSGNGVIEVLVTLQ